MFIGHYAASLVAKTVDKRIGQLASFFELLLPSNFVAVTTVPPLRILVDAGLSMSISGALHLGPTFNSSLARPLVTNVLMQGENRNDHPEPQHDDCQGEAQDEDLPAVA